MSEKKAKMNEKKTNNDVETAMRVSNTSIGIIGNTDLVELDTANGSTSFQGALKVNILKTDVDAILEKNAEGIKILVLSDPKNSSEINLQDVNDVLAEYGLAVDADKLNPILQFVGIDVNGLKLELSTIYFLADFTSTATEIKTDKNKGVEFAFKITIKNEITKKVPSFFVFKQLSFAVWKTDKENIIKRMNLLSIADIIKNI